MAVVKSEALPLRSSDEIVPARQAVRQWAVELGFSLVEQTKVVTAASELARNTVIHGGGGSVLLEVLDEPPRRGLRLTFTDEGPGIPEIALALKDGFTTGSGLGLGLGGSRRLSHEFAIQSTPGHGTTVTITRWKGIT